MYGGCCGRQIPSDSPMDRGVADIGVLLMLGCDEDEPFDNPVP